MQTKYQVLPYDPTFHYPYIGQWFMAHDWDPPPQKDWLPEGFVVEDEGEPICAAFMYKAPTISGMTFTAMEWIVRSPSLAIEEREPALKMLVEAVLKTTRPNELVMTFTFNKRLINLLKGYGFSISDEPVYNCSWFNGGPK